MTIQEMLIKKITEEVKQGSNAILSKLINNVPDRVILESVSNEIKQEMLPLISLYIVKEYTNGHCHETMVVSKELAEVIMDTSSNAYEEECHKKELFVTTPTGILGRNHMGTMYDYSTEGLQPLDTKEYDEEAGEEIPSGSSLSDN